MAYNRASKHQYSGFGILLGMVTLSIHWFAPDTLIEALYGQGLFKLVRIAFDHTLALLPIAFFYVLLAVLVFFVYRFVQKWKRSIFMGWKGIATFSLSLVNFLGWVVFAFYWLWGFNYDRVQLKDRLSWDATRFEADQFVEESEQVLTRLADLRMNHEAQVDSALHLLQYQDLQTTLRHETSQIAAQLGYESSSLMSCRSLRPSGILLRWSTAGFYNPFSGECNIDAGLHTLQKPFVMAHEFFHALGVTGEGDCNFLAYITCHNSTNPLAKYSAELGYWRYLRGGLYRSDPATYEALIAKLPEAVIKDMEAIDRAIAKYPDIAPRIRNAMYSAYLKSNKIEDGLANYGQMVQMIMQWKKNNHSF